MNTSNRNIQPAPGIMDSNNFLSFLRPSAVISHTRADEANMMPLPLDWVPGHWDVICERGKECFEHPGNKHFRVCINRNIDQYVNAKTRQVKSDIVTEIFNEIREDAHSHQKKGEFVKRDLLSRRWYQVSEKEARDKVGQALRDAIKVLRANSRGKAAKQPPFKKANMAHSQLKSYKPANVTSTDRAAISEQQHAREEWSSSTRAAELEDPVLTLTESAVANTFHNPSSSALEMIDSPFAALESSTRKRTLPGTSAAADGTSQGSTQLEALLNSSGMNFPPGTASTNPFKRRRSSLGLSILDCLFNGDESATQQQQQQDRFSYSEALFGGSNLTQSQGPRNHNAPSSLSREFANYLAPVPPPQKVDRNMMFPAPSAPSPWKASLNDMEASIACRNSTRRHSLSTPFGFGLDFSSSASTILGGDPQQSNNSAAQLLSELEPTPISFI